MSKQSTISEGRQSSTKALYWQGFITSAANPKAVIFFAALFPQFIDPSAPLVIQFICLSMTYLLVDASKSGFTLVELIVVIVILGILSVIAVPRFVDFAEDAREAQPGVVCAVDWCGRGNQTSVAGPVTTSGLLTKLWPKGYEWGDRCGVIYDNPEDGTAPRIIVQTDDC